jgi:hypothetical protein
MDTTDIDLIDMNGTEWTRRERYTAARQEIERLRTDAARYRWLRKNHIRSDPDMSGNHRWMSLGRSIGRGVTAEAAIDAAIRAEEE